MATVMTITGRIEVGRKYWVAVCDQLPITTSGDDPQTAVERQLDAALAYLSALQYADPARCASIIRALQRAPEPAATDAPDIFRFPMPEEPMAAIARAVA